MNQKQLQAPIPNPITKNAWTKPIYYLEYKHFCFHSDGQVGCTYVAGNARTHCLPILNRTNKVDSMMQKLLAIVQTAAPPMPLVKPFLRTNKLG
jgi:hypothetical protein